MATNFVQAGKSVTLTAPANVSSGDVVVIGALSGVALHDALSGAEFELGVDGVYDLPADTALVIDEGDAVFWDTTNGWVDKTVTAQRFIGHATADKVSAGTSVSVRLVQSGAATGL